MSNENTKKLIEVIKEKREEIIELSKSCYRKTMDGSCFQGWNVGVIADVDGDIYDYYWSNGTSNTAIYGGRAVRVVNYTTGNDIPMAEVGKDHLSEAEWNKFAEWLFENDIIQDEDQIEDELCYSRIYEFEQDHEMGIIKRLDEEMLEWEVNEYYSETADARIDVTLADLQQQLDYEEECE